MTASSFHIFMGDSESRMGAICEIAAQRQTGQTDVEQYNTQPMERGRLLEDEACRLYEIATDQSVKRVGFVEPDEEDAFSGWIGCSPDRLVGDDGLLEVKCIPEGTQVLTNTGYKNIESLSISDVVAQYNEDGSISYVNPTAIIKKHHSGPIYDFTRYGNVCMSVTPDHRIIYKDAHRKDCASIKECLAEDFIGFSHNKAIPVGGTIRGESILNDWHRLAIAANADGHIQSKHALSFDFSRDRKITRLKSISSNLGLRLKEAPTREFDNPLWNSSHRFTVYVDRADPFKAGLDKIIPFKDINTQTALDFIEELTKWDGTVGVSNIRFYTSIHKSDIDFVAALCAICAKKCSIVKQNGAWLISISGYGVLSKDHNPWFFLSEKIKRDYNGFVYCLTVPSGMFIARLDNSISFVTGNCPVQKTFLTYAYKKKRGQAWIKPEYMTQCQFQMYITGRLWCDFLVYHPTLSKKVLLQRIDRDESYILKIKEAIERSIKDVQIVTEESTLA